MVRAMANRKLEKEVEALTDIEAIVESESGLAPLALAARGELKIARAEEARGNDKQNLEKQGLADLAQAYKIDKKSPYIFLMRGLANCRMNKFAAAEADFKSALRADKTCYEANRLLTLLHAASEIPGLRDGREALEYGKKAAEISKYSDWACLDALAAAHAEAGEYDEAARTAHEASELAFGENRDLCLERAKLYESRMPLRIKWSKNRA